MNIMTLLFQNLSCCPEITTIYFFFYFPQDDHESGSSSTSRSVSDSSKAVAKPRRIQQAAPSDPDLPPGEWWSWGQ